MTRDCWNTLLDTDWEPHLRDEFTEPYWTALQLFIESERAISDVYPPCVEWFTALGLTTFADTKAVIVGQDPYHGAGQAHGLAFSVPAGVRVPPSLAIIHRELHGDLGIPIPNHGNLEQWASEGVLLLNPTLTVSAGRAGSHEGQGWDKFTNRVIQAVNAKVDRVVFMLWGEKAQKKASLIDESRHTILRSSHPSPISACSTTKPFCRSRPFSRANEALGPRRIDWTLT